MPSSLATEFEAAHPGVKLEARTLKAVEGADVAHPLDLLLAKSCLEKNAAALERFEATHKSTLAKAVGKVNADPAFVDEALQVLREKLFVDAPSAPARLRQYVGKGPLGGWLRAFATGVAIDLKRSRLHRATGDALEPNSEGELAAAEDWAQQASPELKILKGRHKSQFRTAFEQAVGELSPDERLVLRMRYVDGLSREEIGKAIGVHRTTAMRTLERAHAAVLERTRARMQKELKLEPKELMSLMRAVQASIGPSIMQVLKSKREPR